MKAVVFGGSGFLGSHVADTLTKKGYEVTIFDSKESIYLKDDQKMVIGDILDFEKVRSVVEGADYVYNFAGIAGIEESAQNPVETIKTNVLGNVHLLEACHLNNVKRYIFASTLYVYSNSGSFYRASKQSCELTIEAYAERFDLEYTILRYGSLYGPRADRNNWIYRMLMQALTDKKIIRQGDGKELREYIHVTDAARLSVKILEKEFKNEYVIIAGQQRIKVEDVMIMVKEMLHNEITLEFVEGSYDTHYEVTPFNFRPKLAERIIDSSYVDLGQGILEMLHYMHESEDIKSKKLTND